MSLASKSRCAFRWTYPIFYMFEQKISYCCRTPNIDVTDDQIKELGPEVFSNHPYIKERRSEMLNNIFHKDCISCWQLEDKNMPSPRSVEFFDEISKGKIEGDQLSSFLSYSHPDIVEVVLSRQCDAKCVYCSEHYSSEWLKEKLEYNLIQKQDIQPQKRNKDLEEHFWHWLDTDAFKTVSRIGFIGGEPLITSTLYDCFDKCLEIAKKHHREKKVELCITTNLGASDEKIQKFLKMIPKLKDYFSIQLQVSIESTGHQFEYIRYGVKWDQFTKNLNLMLDIDDCVVVSVLPTINILSIASLENLVSFIHSLHKSKHKSIKIHYNSVTEPFEMSPINAPRSFATFISQAIARTEACYEDTIDGPQRQYYLSFIKQLENAKASILENHQINIPLLNKLFSFLFDNDKKRNSNFKNIFPEFSKYLLLTKVSSDGR